MIFLFISSEMYFTSIFSFLKFVSFAQLEEQKLFFTIRQRLTSQILRKTTSALPVEQTNKKLKIEEK
jgi:hypothetical protein